LIFVLLVLLSIDLAQSQIRCLDGSGNPVDWWISYKLPKLTTGHLTSGKAYAYMDESTSQFTIPATDIDSPTSFLVRTLNQLYKNTTHVGYVLWNDEAPDGSTNNNKAHAKGIVVFDTSQGFFFRHSIPNFPPAKESGFSYPASGAIYGQTLICLTLDINTIDTVASQFLVNYPLVYSYGFVGDASKTQNIRNLAVGNHVTAKSNSIVTIHTKKGLAVSDYAKSKEWDNDLWDSLVAPNVKQNFFVETWGRPLMPSLCNASKFHILNIKEVKVDSNAVFSETKDHAKWGISEKGNTVCIGDINRMTSQRKRGGGTSCINVDKVYKQFSAIISAKENC